MLSPEMWAAGGTVVAAFVAYLGIRYTGSQSREAQQQSNALEEKAIDAAAYERARESYEAAIANYLREIDSLTGRVTALNERIAALNGEMAASDTTNRDQRRQLSDALDKMVSARNEHQDHLRRCQVRLDRLKKRLANDDHITPEDIDLQLEP